MSAALPVAAEVGVSDRRRPDTGVIATILFALPALTPLAGRLLPRGGDLLLHYYRVVALGAMIRRGLLFSRWMPDLAYGYGYPLFHYYAPLSSYIAVLPTLLGLSTDVAVRLALGLSIVGVALGVYLWVRELTSDGVAGCVAAVGALYAPFVIITPLSRGSLSDAVALALLPFAFWSLQRLGCQPGRGRLVVSGGLIAALMLSHNVTGMLGFVLCAAYAAASLFRREWRTSAWMGAALLLGAGLSSFFWLPAIADRGWTRLRLFIASPQYDFRNNFVSLGELLRLPARAVEGLMNPPAPYHMSALLIVLATLGVVAAWARRLRVRVELLALWCGGMVSLYLCLPQSAWVWEAVPLLQLIQFPFRFLGPASVLLAAPAGALFTAIGRAPLGRRWLSQAAGLAAVVLLMLPSIPLLYPLTDKGAHGETAADVTAYQQSSGALGATSQGEYLSEIVETFPSAPAFAGMDEGALLASKLDPASIPGDAQIQEGGGGQLSAEWSISSPVGFDATVRTFFFPGWRAMVDGREVPLSAASETGLIQIPVPAGEHRVALVYLGTLASRWGDALAGAALLAVLCMLAWPRPKRRAPEGVIATRAARLPARVGLGFAAVGFVLLVVKVAVLDRIDSPWRSSFDGKRVPDAAQTVDIRLGGGMSLLGIGTAPLIVEPGETFSLVLYWSASEPISTSYHTSMQVVDAQGEKIAQEDHYWPGGYPTVWWRPGEFDRDEYSVSIAPSAGEGVYTVVVAVYDDEGERLPVPGDTPLAMQGLIEVCQVGVQATASTSSGETS